MLLIRKVYWFGLFALIHGLDGEKPTKKKFKEFNELGTWLLFDNGLIKYKEADEYEGYDGWYNNPSNPVLGAVDTHLLRRVPAAYEDGTYQPAGKDRPNPLTLSEKLLKGPIGTVSNTGKNALLVFFGQQIVEEILDAQRPACPPEYFNIDIPTTHMYRNETNHTVLPVLRTRYDQRSGFSPNNPRQQLNEITPYIDGGLIYGTSKTWADSLRLYANGTLAESGTLASSDDGLFPELNKIRLPMANVPPPVYHDQFIKNHELLNVDRFHKLGNPRGNENPYLLTFGVIWFRWHNFLARCIKRRVKNKWTDERIFNEARKWVIASQQQIIFYEWLPEWLHRPVPKYEQYDPSIDPQIDQFFQAAAFRFGHTLVPPAVKLRDYKRNGCKMKFENVTGTNYLIRTCNHYWKPQESIKYQYTSKQTQRTSDIVDIDRLLLGMAYQASEKEDSDIVEDLRGRVFGPLEFSRRDLMALNIQRGRDHGLPDYNSARKAFGLTYFKNFSEYSKSILTAKKKLTELQKLYNNDINNIDVWIGGILETTAYGPGELFATVILDQFQRIRNGDRFWFENINNGQFSVDEIERLKNLTIYDIIMAVTLFDQDDVPKRAFALPMKLDINSSSTSEGCEKAVSDCTLSENFANVHLGMNVTNMTFICYHESINYTNLESCTKAGTYDYFSNSQMSFITSFVVIATFIIGVFSLIFYLFQYEKMKRLKTLKKMEADYFKTLKMDTYDAPFAAMEWQGFKKPLRNIVIRLDEKNRQIRILNPNGVLLRRIVLNSLKVVEIYFVTDNIHIGLKFKNEYDLILKFDSPYLRVPFDERLEKFLFDINVRRERITDIPLQTLLKAAVTKTQRQKKLEMFFRGAFSQVFQIEKESFKIDPNVAREIINTELTLNEFADALSIEIESEFAKKMFQLVDKDKNGFISSQEFIHMLIIFSEGSPRDKVGYLFRMYDINDSGQLSNVDFVNMIKSIMEVVNAKVDHDELELTIEDMMREAGIEKKNIIRFEDFVNLLSNEKYKLDVDRLDFSVITSKDIPMRKVKETFQTLYEIPVKTSDGGRIVISEEQELQTVSRFEVTRKVTEVSFSHKVVHWLSLKATLVFWIAFLTLIVWLIFAERFFHYYIEREHSGLRRILGAGVAITRGAASAQMFCYAAVLITMCRQSITLLRDTRLYYYIPFDSNVTLHKYFSCWGLFFTVVHCVGHGFNFYHISTQTSDDLTCLFRNTFHSTHEIPKFHFWFWQTITGITGFLLVLLTTVMYCFTIPKVRRRLYNAFWFTHSLYPLFYILMYLHGSGRLIQKPLFFYYFAIPTTIFIIDTGYRLSRKKVKINVVDAELLSSDVTMLKFTKPTGGFSYKSGQWVRIACLNHSAVEYHPFTLSSSPHELYLTVHIRAVGPWTRQIRTMYDCKPYPKIYLDGPYGEGHQNWDQYNVSVLIGGGIGVTPFASILKDIVYKNYSSGQVKNIKVYFFWVTRTQKQFEWVVDIIRNLEAQDKYHLISVHVFITQFYKKYDLRTMLLYLCERHFQKTSNKSLFTGLKAITHFGRPNFHHFFQAIQTLHPTCPKIGVFSCGPPPMTRSAEQACVLMNTQTRGPIFEHHFKNY